MNPSSRQSQQGLTLLVGLIMLVLITLLVVTSFNLTNTQLKVVNNAQVQMELETAANAALEQTISSAAYQDAHGITTSVDLSRFAPNLAAPVTSGADMAVAVTPTCVRTRKLTTTEVSALQAPLVASYEALMAQQAPLSVGAEKTALLAAADAAKKTDEKWRTCNFGTEGFGAGGGLVEGAATGGSGASGATICTDSLWNIRAVATSKLDTAAQVETHVAVSAYADISKVPSACQP